MRNLAIAREAVRAFNQHWVEAFASLLAPDATFTDASTGITVSGTDEIRRSTAALRRSLPGVLGDPQFKVEGRVVTARASVSNPGDFLEVLEFDDEGRIAKITTRYGGLRVLKNRRAVSRR